MASTSPASSASEAEAARAEFDGRFGQGHSLRPAPLGQGARLGLEDLLHLGFQCWVEILALSSDRAGGPDGGFRRHGRRMAGEREDGPGAAGHRPAGCHIDDHRHAAGPNGLHHAAHQVDRAAGGVELQHHGFGGARLGQAQPAVKVLGHGRGERTACLQHQHHAAGLAGGRQGHSQSEQDPQQDTQTSSSHAALQPRLYGGPPPRLSPERSAL